LTCVDPKNVVVLWNKDLRHREPNHHFCTGRFEFNKDFKTRTVMFSERASEWLRRSPGHAQRRSPVFSWRRRLPFAACFVDARTRWAR